MKNNLKIKKYHCSKHGNIGHPDCKECWENLRNLCLDNNAVLIEGDEQENIQLNKTGGKKQ